MKRPDPGQNSPKRIQTSAPEDPIKNPTGKTARPGTGATSRKLIVEPTPNPAEPSQADSPASSELNATIFRRRLNAWYRRHARPLPWRLTSAPYRIWVSEVMLQQTRVAAVVDHYNEFLRRFPTLVSLALAPEPDVLAAWSGLGYYRRARMLHKAAQFIVLERDGRLPENSIELRTLPGIGEYTAAAIASIAFGEPVAVVDGNVERVLLRIAGDPEYIAAPSSAAARTFVRTQAQALIPTTHAHPSHPAAHGLPRAHSVWDASERIAIAASAHPESLAGDLDEGCSHTPRSPLTSPATTTRP